MNVINYLEDRQIEYVTSGKNTSTGWLSIKCPYVDCDDPSAHLGIQVESGTGFNCWRCGRKGPMIHLIAKLEKISFQKAAVIIDQYPDEYSQYQAKSSQDEIRDRKPLDLLKFSSKNFPDKAYKYLERRQFDPESTIQKYDLYYGNIESEFKFRIIAPVIMNRRVVNCTGRDISGSTKTKYKHCHNEDSVVPMKQCLYNIDSVRDSCLIVEGITDVWRIGDGSIAVFGIEYTMEQIYRIVNKGVLKAFILFDEEPIANKRAGSLASALSSFIPVVEVLHLTEEGADPADLSDEDVKEIREIAFQERS